MYFFLITSSGILPILCYPSLTEVSHVSPQIVLPEGRKFAEKPNATKKVPPLEDRNDLDDISTNQIPVRLLKRIIRTILEVQNYNITRWLYVFLIFFFSMKFECSISPINLLNQIRMYFHYEVGKRQRSSYQTE